MKVIYAACIRDGRLGYKRTGCYEFYVAGGLLAKYTCNKYFFNKHQKYSWKIWIHTQSLGAKDAIRIIHFLVWAKDAIRISHFLGQRIAKCFAISELFNIFRNPYQTKLRVTIFCSDCNEQAGTKRLPGIRLCSVAALTAKSGVDLSMIGHTRSSIFRIEAKWQA